MWDQLLFQDVLKIEELCLSKPRVFPKKSTQVLKSKFFFLFDPLNHH